MIITLCFGFDRACEVHTERKLLIYSQILFSPLLASIAVLLIDTCCEMELRRT